MKHMIQFIIGGIIFYLLTSLLGQTRDMKDENGAVVLSYTSVPSMMHEIIGRTTACPCSG